MQGVSPTQEDKAHQRLGRRTNATIRDGNILTGDLKDNYGANQVDCSHVKDFVVATRDTRSYGQQTGI